MLEFDSFVRQINKQRTEIFQVILTTLALYVNKHTTVLYHKGQVSFKQFIDHTILSLLKNFETLST